MIPVYILLQTLVQDYGQDEFMEDFGMFISPNEVVISSNSGKNIPSSFESRLKKMLSSIPSQDGGNMKLILAKQSNFKGLSENEVGPFLQELVESSLSDVPTKVQGSTALMEFYIDMESDDSGAESAKEMLFGVPNMPNVRVIYSDGVSDMNLRDDSDIINLDAMVNVGKKLVTGRPDRDSIITADDQLNLKIALGNCNSVEEFLAMI